MIIGILRLHDQIVALEAVESAPAVAHVIQAHLIGDSRQRQRIGSRGAGNRKQVPNGDSWSISQSRVESPSVIILTLLDDPRIDGDGTVSQSQKSLYESLKKHYPKLNFDRLRVWMDFRGWSVNGVEPDKKTRGRSFLFFAAGAFAVSGFDKRFVLYVPKNGLIALNVPLDPLRLGSFSTRTTHPFYIAKWNEVLKMVGINGHRGCSFMICLHEILAPSRSASVSGPPLSRRSSWRSPPSRGTR